MTTSDELGALTSTYCTITLCVSTTTFVYSLCIELAGYLPVRYHCILYMVGSPLEPSGIIISYYYYIHTVVYGYSNRKLLYNV